MKQKLLLALVINGLILTGCGDKNDSTASDKSNASTPATSTKTNTTNKSATSNKNSTDDEKEYLKAKKVSSYIKATNAYGSGPLDGTSSWPDQEIKTKKGIENKDYRVIKSSLYFNSRGSKSLQEKLSKALADNAIVIEPADTQARELIAALDKLVPVWEDLEKYSSTKRYEDDNGAKGKELMETFTPAYNQVTELYGNFNASVKQLAEEQKKIRLETYKKQGRLLELYTEESLELARGMLSQFSSLKDFKDKAKVEKANALLAQLEDKLDALQKELKAAESSGKSTRGYSMIISSLEGFIGDYRSVRKEPSSVAERMVKQFNRAVEYYNNR